MGCSYQLSVWEAELDTLNFTQISYMACEMKHTDIHDWPGAHFSQNVQGMHICSVHSLARLGSVTSSAQTQAK